MALNVYALAVPGQDTYAVAAVAAYVNAKS
jgi:hypothetical protein